jgi:multidrug transporter EmrE-like cation transporter
MGMSTLGPLLLAVAGGVLYHVAAKSIPKDLAPGLVLVVAYAVALIVGALAHASLPLPGGATSAARLLHPGVVGLGLGAALIELGYILTYRAAVPISVASVVVNGLVATLLVVVGAVLFSEGFTLRRASGILLSLAGLWLLRR